MEALLYIKLFFILFLLDFDFAYGKWTEKENFIFLQHVMLEPELLTENNSAVVLDELTRRPAQYLILKYFQEATASVQVTQIS